MGDPVAKIFVGGLNQVTNSNSLRAYFSRFGSVVATNIVFDRVTQKSRGFGFVQFASHDTIRDIMPMQHSIDGRVVELKPAQKSGARTLGTKIPEFNPLFQKKVEEERNKNARKVFVGGLKLSTTVDGIISYFERFGPIDECTITRNKQTGRSRGFGFVTFSSPDTVDEALKHRHTIEGKGVEIKRAENRGGKIPTMPDKRNDRGGGPGGQQGNKGGFGGSGYGLIYGAYEFHAKVQQAMMKQQQAARVPAPRQVVSLQRDRSSASRSRSNAPTLNSNSTNTAESRKRRRSRSMSNAKDDEERRNVRQRRG